MSKIKETPIHEHDCDSCIYLGRWMSERYVPGKEVDLWVCPNAVPFGWTPICRFGEYGDYGSGACFAPNCPDLGEAAKRALAGGHVSQEDYDKVFEEYAERTEA
jgi:hypothetical protein